MTKNNQEQVDEKEQKREVALQNLSESALPNLAAAFMINNSKGQYGEAVDSASEQYLYYPSMEDETVSKSITSALLTSRGDGPRYSGSITENQILQQSVAITEESLMNLKVEDVADLMGYEGDISGYRDAYIKDLIEGEDENGKKTAEGMIRMYIQYLTDNKAAYALSKRAKNIGTKGLEKILNPQSE